MSGPAGTHPLRLAAAAASSERTLVTTEELLSFGLTPDAIRYRRATGILHLVFSGVYTFGSGELPPLAREQAALIACGERSFVSHHSSIFIWDLVTAAPALVDVSVIAGTTSTRTGLRLHRIKSIDRRDVTSEKGLRLSTPARALLEVAGRSSIGEVERAFDAALAKRLITPAAIESVLRRHAGRRGCGRLRAVADDRGGTRSDTALRMRRLIRSARLPIPEEEVQIGPYRVDFLWRELGLVAEVDGYGFHAGRRGFEADHERDLYLKERHLDVIRFTWRQLRYEPAVVLARLVRALERAAATAQVRPTGS